MKFSTLIPSFFLLGLIFASNCFAQEENEYFLHNPVWGTTSVCSAPYPCVATENYNYFVNGDTLINEIEYKKLFRSGTGIYNWFAQPPAGCSGTYSFENEPSFLIRSEGLRMYIWDPFMMEEQLLYDFDLEVNDLLPLTHNNYSEILVTAIDSIYTPYGYRKRFALTGDTWSEYLVEGIGHSKGLVEPMNQALECGWELVCYSLENMPYYPDQGQNCSFTVGVYDRKIAQDVIVFPNPFKDFTTIQLAPGVHCQTITIYDQMGRIMNRPNVPASDRIRIDRGNLGQGLYFVEMQLDNGLVSTAKFIIAD